MQLVVRFHRLLVVRELPPLRALVQAVLVMVAREQAHLVLAVPLVALVPQVAHAPQVPLVLSDLVALVVAPADLVVLVVDPVVLVLAVPVVEVAPVVALAQVVDVVLRVAVVVVAVVVRMIYSHQ